jgi:hypothetical protein
VTHTTELQTLFGHMKPYNICKMLYKGGSEALVSQALAWSVAGSNTYPLSAPPKTALPAKPLGPLIHKTLWLWL